MSEWKKLGQRGDYRIWQSGNAYQVTKSENPPPNRAGNYYSLEVLLRLKGIYEGYNDSLLAAQRERRQAACSLSRQGDASNHKIDQWRREIRNETIDEMVQALLALKING